MSETAKTKTVKQVCRCENCGNEAEMMVTCSLEEVAEADTETQEAEQAHEHEHRKVKGHGVCSHCGNEADIWVEI